MIASGVLCLVVVGSMGNIELAEAAAKNLIELESQHSRYWVLLSNIYSSASRWRDAASVRAAMKDGGVEKSPDYSWIEVGGSELHRFLDADKFHKECDDIYLTLDGLTEQLKDEGYVPVVESSLATLQLEFRAEDSLFSIKMEIESMLSLLQLIL